VVHAAGVLDDGVTLQLTTERFERVMAPKVLGALHLHQLTLKHALDFFVMFSSAASVLGNPGQGNYASANEFMDALAHRRREQRLPALSINWGPWHEAGLAATPDRAARLASRGLGSLTDAAGIATLDRLMRSTATQAVVLPDASFQTWKHWYPGTASMLETLLSTLSVQAPAVEAGQIATLAKLPEHERLQHVEQYLVDVTRRVLRMSPAKSLAVDQPLNRLGLDSLMAVELKNRIDADLAVTLPVSKVLLCNGLCHLASDVLSQIELTSAPEVATSLASTDNVLELYSLMDSDELFDDLDEPAHPFLEQKNSLSG
jgi:phthiocerol/phenolphthiocerol synthesis type-I polyketide synthase C